MVPNPKNLKVVVDVPLKSHQSEVGFVLRVLFNLPTACRLKNTSATFLRQKHARPMLVIRLVSLSWPRSLTMTTSLRLLSPPPKIQLQRLLSKLLMRSVTIPLLMSDFPHVHFIVLYPGIQYRSTAVFLRRLRLAHHGLPVSPEHIHGL